MKKAFAFILAAVFALQGCSFPRAYPIESNLNILIAGLDTDESGDIILTAYTDTVSPSAKPGEEQISYKLYVATGKTVSEANSRLHELNEKHLLWYHAKYILVGEDAAKRGIDRLFAFFTEDDETKLLFRTAVVKGTTALEFLQIAAEIKSGVADYLDSLFEDVKNTGKSREIHLLNYAVNRQIPWNDIFIPEVEIRANPAAPDESGGEDKQNGGERNVIKLNGFALFNQDRLSGFIEDDSAMALNILNNELFGAKITVKSNHGNEVSLQIMRCSASFKPEFYPLGVSIEIRAESYFAEFYDADNLTDRETVDFIKQQQNELIKNSVEQCIKTMQGLGSDAACFGDKFYHKDPIKWRQIKNDWRRIFPDMRFSVKVRSEILSTFELKEPVSG